MRELGPCCWDHVLGNASWGHAAGFTPKRTRLEIRVGLWEIWAGAVHGIEPQQWLFLRKKGEKGKERKKRRRRK
ncbi:hypothetical protein TIFTF001_044061 [Ficus carica]|uniref:Uncharacterized protein n=1 Tax=Ficus carica TaxID=3494 RepID=A0AA87Z089_FICCA|nr:hypothetical protein TIFTF001_044061 [Ficus carica]